MRLFAAVLMALVSCNVPGNIADDVLGSGTTRLPTRIYRVWIADDTLSGILLIRSVVRGITTDGVRLEISEFGDKATAADDLLFALQVKPCPHLIITDLHMPRLFDGRRVVTQCGEVPTIVVTATHQVLLSEFEPKAPKYATIGKREIHRLLYEDGACRVVDKNNDRETVRYSLKRAIVHCLKVGR